MAMYNKNLLKHKVKILNELGLTNSEAVREHLLNAPDIDEAASKMISNFFDGDKTFVDSNANPEFYLRFIKAKYPNAETIYEDTLVSLIGQKGLEILRQTHSIETCAMFNGRKLYAL